MICANSHAMAQGVVDRADKTSAQGLIDSQTHGDNFSSAFTHTESPFVVPFFTNAGNASNSRNASNASNASNGDQSAEPATTESTGEDFITACEIVHVSRSYISPNMTAALGYLAIGLQISGVLWGVTTLLVGLFQMSNAVRHALRKVAFGATGVIAGCAAPVILGWIF
jgi:hypothetical protein